MLEKVLALWEQAVGRGGIAGVARSGVHFFAIFLPTFFLKKSRPPEGKKKSK
jgi:hypothetical protein